MAKGLTVVAFAAGATLLLSGLSRGDVYRYADRNGAIAFTNNLISTPAEGRTNALLVSRDPERPKQSSPPASSPAGQPAPSEGTAREAGSLPAATSPAEQATRSVWGAVGAVVAFLILFMLAGKAVASLGLKKGRRLVRTLLTVALLTYLALTHLDGMLRTFLRVRDEAATVRKNGDRRVNAAEEALRQATGETAVRPEMK